MPDCISESLPVFDNGIYRIIIKPSWHTDGMVTGLFHQQVTDHRKHNRQQYGRQRFSTHIIWFEIKKPPPDGNG